MDSSFTSFVLAFSAGITAFGVASVALAVVFVQGRFESSRLFGPSAGLVASGLLAGFLAIVASSGGVPWAFVGVPAVLAVGLSVLGLSLARGLPVLPGYGRIDLWLLWLCLLGSLALVGLLVAGILLLLALFCRIALTEFSVGAMVLQLMFPVLFLASLAFFLACLTGSGNATAVLLVVAVLAFWALAGTLRASSWFLFHNPFTNVSAIQAAAWAKTTLGR